MSIRTIINLITTSIVTSVMAVVTFAPDQAEAARAFIVFGDSLVDSGNNNYLATTARADSPPYGIDHPTHRPTGRFSNGLNLPDIVGQKMGLEPMLPYLSPQLNGEGLLHGANFASAGAGILNETGFQFVNVLTISRQFELFQQYQQRVNDMIGPDQSQQLVSNALVLITLGGNDFINNYFLTPFSARRSQFTIPDYCRYLISEYRKILQKLYELGARRVLVTGIGALGCVPVELAMSLSMDGNCVTDQQKASTLFNPALDQMLQDLNSELGSDVFIFVNAFAIHTDMMDNPQKYGFTASKMACCGQGRYNGIGLCNRLSNLCPDRDLYVFWDSFHPTERALHVIVEKLVSGSNEYVKPMNLSTIMALDAETIN